jgi:hypothetical protein
MKKTMILVAGLASMISASAFAAGGYSAIAFDPTDSLYGRYQGAFSESEAESNALQACENAGGANCEVVGWAYDGYVALAIGDGNHFGTGSVHDTEADADQASLAACEQVTTNCHIALEAVSYDY